MNEHEAKSRSFVLNAFRHHRVSRGVAMIMPKVISACSTPFGITEFRGKILVNTK